MRTTPGALAVSGRRRLQAGLMVLSVAAAGLVAAVTASPPAQAASIDTNASYVLVNRGSGKALDVYNLATTDGASGRAMWITRWRRACVRKRSERGQFAVGAGG